MKKIFFLTLLSVSALPMGAFCQVDTAWVRRYNGPGNNEDQITGLGVDENGNVYVTGYSVIGGSDYEYATIKYNQNGNELWVRRHNGVANGFDRAEALVVEKNGNVYVTGVSYNDFFTIKYDPEGNELWTAHYNGPGEDWATAITIDEKGNIYVIGASQRNYAGGACSDVFFDYLTVKYDSNGNQLWASRYNHGIDNINYAYNVAVDYNGNVYVSGHSDVCYSRATEWITVKYDSGGNQIWVQPYNSWLESTTGGPGAMKLDASGNLYITGASYAAQTSRDYTTIKYNPIGNQMWTASYHEFDPSRDWALAMDLDLAGNVYITGYSNGPGSDKDIATIKYDSGGNQIWARRYNGPANWTDWGRGIYVDPSGNVYVGGWSTGNGTSTDFVVIKYDSAGNELWVARYDNLEHGLDKAEKMAVDINGNIYLAGTSIYGASGYDFSVVKFSPLPTVRGDLNLDGVLTLADIVLAINQVFLGETTPAAPAACDFNCDGLLSGVDVVILLRMFYLGAPAPC